MSTAATPAAVVGLVLTSAGGGGPYGVFNGQKWSGQIYPIRATSSCPASDRRPVTPRLPRTLDERGPGGTPRDAGRWPCALRSGDAGVSCARRNRRVSAAAKSEAHPAGCAATLDVGGQRAPLVVHVDQRRMRRAAARPVFGSAFMWRMSRWRAGSPPPDRPTNGRREGPARPPSEGGGEV